EGRREEENQFFRLLYQILVDRCQRLVGMFRRGAAREHRPGLCERIDAALIVLSGTQRCAIIEIGPAIPLAVPGTLLHGPPQVPALVPIVSGTLCLAASLRERGEVRQESEQEPAVPNALALSAAAHAIHAIVPVAGAHERQSVRSEAATMLQGAHAVLIQA